MSLSSGLFLGFALVFILAMRLLPARQGMRAVVLGAANLVFIASFVSQPVQAVPLALFVVGGWLATRLSAGKPSTLVFGLMIGAVVLVFVWLKHYSIVAFVPSLPVAYLTLGLSYVLFRIIHLMVDVRDEVIPPPSAWDYFNYVLFFLNFVSGPIQRYQDFSSQLGARDADIADKDVHHAIRRVLLGLLIMLVIAPKLLFVTNHFQSSLFISLAGRGLSSASMYFCFAALAYLVYLYVNFSAYMNIVVGIGRLAGFQLPENFDKPFAAENFLDLWSRWHITLSEWFKFYVFNPLLKSLASRWGTPAAMPYLGAVAFFVTFLLMGIWHGSTSIFLFYGLFLGAGVAANKFYQIEIVKRLGRDGYRKLKGRAWYLHLCRGFTLSYFAIALCCLWVHQDQAGLFVTSRGLTAGIVAMVLLSLLIAVVSFVISALVGLAGRTFGAHRTAASGLWLSMQTAFAAILLVLLASNMGQGPPEFVYKAF